MSKILSITIPSYNVEKFLENTLSSFVDECILDKLEVIVVDDGSKDSTAEVAQSYVDKYPQTFKLISKENGGHGSTINTGIRNATGKYFKVVDGDDWVNTKDFALLIENLSKTDSDMVFTNYIEYYDDTGATKNIDFDGYENGKEYDFSYIANQPTIGMHAIVYKTSILKEKNIELDEKCFYVDVEYVLYPVPYISTVTFYDLHIYIYRLAQATQSVSIDGFKKHIDNHLKVLYNLVDFSNAYSNSNEKSIEKENYINRRISEMVIVQTQIYLSYGCHDKSAKKGFKEFDSKLRKMNVTIYEMSGRLRGQLKLLRKTKFVFYKPIVSITNMRSKN